MNFIEPFNHFVSVHWTVLIVVLYAAVLSRLTAYVILKFL